MEDFFDIVDINNNVIGKEKRGTVHEKGLMHRAVRIFVFTSKGEVFLQKRRPIKDICPLKWGISVGEHLKPKESYEKAASRGLQEELGLKADITKIRDVHLIRNEYNGGKKKDYEFVELFKAVTDKPIKWTRMKLQRAGFSG